MIPRYRRLLVPFLSRPPIPAGDQALRLARIRERHELEGWAPPPLDMPRDRMPSVVPGRGNCRGTRCGGRAPALDAEQDLEAAELRATGLSYRAIGQELGCSKEAAQSGAKRGLSAATQGGRE